MALAPRLLLSLAACACVAHAQEVPTCSGIGGVWDETAGCCLCRPGYTNPPAGARCSACADGYVQDPDTGRCTNGRDGSECVDSRPFPYYGCGGMGRCSQDPNDATRAVFPCVCLDARGVRVSCVQKQARVAAGVGGESCAPARTPRMMTTYPNEPTVGRPFALTILGCSLRAEDEYLVIPAFADDGVTENFCGARVPVNGAWVHDACKFSMDASKHLVLTPEGAEGAKTPMRRGTTALQEGDEPKTELAESSTQTGGAFLSPTCKDGFVINNLSIVSQANGISEATFQQMTLLEGFAAEPFLYKVCRLTTQPTQTGLDITTWAEIDAHNPHSDERFDRIKISPVAVYSAEDAGNLSGAGAEGAEEGCCDGFEIFDWCVPLWVIVLLWLIPCSCLSCLIAMRQRREEADEGRNNKKYELSAGKLNDFDETIMN